jgi:hypothetical protein
MFESFQKVLIISSYFNGLEDHGPVTRNILLQRVAAPFSLYECENLLSEQEVRHLMPFWDSSFWVAKSPFIMDSIPWCLDPPQNLLGRRHIKSKFEIDTITVVQWVCRN